MKKPFQQLKQRGDIIRQFTPNWFTVTMGTGVVALIIAELPIASAFFWQLGNGLWHFNILLFVFFYCVIRITLDQISNRSRTGVESPNNEFVFRSNSDGTCNHFKWFF